MADTAGQAICSKRSRMTHLQHSPWSGR